MAVEVNSTRKAVEISWDASGDSAVTPEPPETFPPYPVDPDYGIEEGGPPTATHPIYLPPYIDNSLPGDQPIIDNTLPGDQPRPDNTLPGDQPRPDNTLPGDQPVINPLHDEILAVQVFAQGQDGDWSNGPVMKNDGLAVLTYPKDFAGESYVEVRALDGSLVDSGTIQVLA